MSIPTNFTDDWWLERDSPKTNLEEVRNSETGEIIGYRQVNIFTVVLVRYVYRITTFVSNQGERRASFQAKTGPDTSITVAYVGKNFYCTEHVRSLVDAKTGKYEERQTWVHRSVGDLIPANGLMT